MTQEKANLVKGLVKDGIPAGNLVGHHNPD
jgi:hypothetical protein